jgi:hypothetical protein
MAVTLATSLKVRGFDSRWDHQGFLSLPHALRITLDAPRTGLEFCLIAGAVLSAR